MQMELGEVVDNYTSFKTKPKAREVFYFIDLHH